MLNIPRRPQEFEEPDWWEVPSEHPEDPPQARTTPPEQRGKKRKSIFQRLPEWIRQTTRILLLVNGLVIVIFLTWMGINLMCQMVEFLKRTVFGGAW